ncbi:LCP family protein [Acetonema longum]|nr:LCP family protein [Acetonema longum]
MERHTQEQGEKQRPVWLYAVLILLLLTVTAAVTFYWFAGSEPWTPKRTKNTQTSGQTRSDLQEGKVNILLLGVDKRVNDASRSDTIMVATVDIKTKETSLLSVPRDTWVKIPGRRWDKINHAHMYGGRELVQRTVEELLGIPIDYYVSVDFSGFTRLVDAIGGVDLEVEDRMYYTDPYDNLVIDLQPGMQHLDGGAAIQYVRYRNEDGDIGRIARQQRFLKAMLDEVTSPAILINLPGIVKEANNMVETDLSLSDMLGLTKLLKETKDKGVKTDILPGIPMDLHEISYWIPDIMAMRDYIAQSQGFTQDVAYRAASRRLAAESDQAVQYEIESMRLEALKAAAEQEPEPEEKEDKAVSSKSKSKSKNKSSKARIERDPRTGLPVKQSGGKRSSAASQASATQNLPPAPKPTQPKPVDSRVKVEILNGSDDAAAGGRMADLLRRQGFEIIGVNNTAENRYTAVISHTTSSVVVNKLTNLPFNYVLQVSRDEKKAGQVTVIVGQDYAGGR